MNVSPTGSLRLRAIARKVAFFIAIKAEVVNLVEFQRFVAELAFPFVSSIQIHYYRIVNCRRLNVLLSSGSDEVQFLKSTEGLSWPVRIPRLSVVISVSRNERFIAFDGAFFFLSLSDIFINLNELCNIFIKVSGEISSVQQSVLHFVIKSTLKQIHKRVIIIAPLDFTCQSHKLGIVIGDTVSFLPESVELPGCSSHCIWIIKCSTKRIDKILISGKIGSAIFFLNMRQSPLESLVSEVRDSICNLL